MSDVETILKKRLEEYLDSDDAAIDVVSVNMTYQHQLYERAFRTGWTEGIASMHRKEKQPETEPGALQ